MSETFRLIVFLCLSVSFGVQAEFYKWVDKDGRTHFSDKPPAGQQKQNVEASKKASAASSTVSTVQSNRPGASAPKAQTSYSHPSASEVLRVRKLFESGKFDQLNRVLADSLQAVKKDIGNESHLREVYQVFRQDDPAWEVLFDRWVSQYPQQYQGYLARATYLVYRGWEARGGAYIDKTPQEYIDQMRAFMDRAQADLTRALDLEADTLWAYCVRINIAKSGGNYKGALYTLEQATTRYPATYLARKYYIETLDPKWGGSPLSMVGFATSAQHYADINPRLHRLLSYAYYEAGRMAYINKEYAKASEFLSIAIENGGRPRSYFMRGKIYAREDDHEKALADFNAAIKQDKEDGDYYYWRAKSFAAVKRYDESLIDIQRAYELKPEDKWINKFRVKLMSYAKRSDIPPVDAGASDAGSAESLFRQAKKLIEDRQPEQAKVILDRAIRMSPTEFRYYQLADHALFIQGRTRDILDYWESYLALKPNDDRAYLERSGTYYHLQDFDAAKLDAKRAMDLGNSEAERLYERLRQLTKS
ncbi:DUF4124 domain-containing protein [Marinobacter fonticola]|uniref:DUF4124 domain-containing protein n=1 Tax=Marinobacter fonticola TaxID=2603215 RepID=UPI0011E736F5|nr:DUF4124 domain-containing protein [Marinobacter fonticola]